MNKEYMQKIAEIAKEIERESREHITTSGLRFVGVSLAEIIRILEKYGYKHKAPF